MLYIVSLFSEERKDRLLDRNPQLRDYVFRTSKTADTLYALVQARPLFTPIDMEKFHVSYPMREVLPISIYQDTEVVAFATASSLYVSRTRGQMTDEKAKAIIQKLLNSLPPVYTGKLITAWGATMRKRENEA